MTVRGFYDEPTEDLFACGFTWKAAVVDLGWCSFSGYPAWLFWLFVHLMQLVQFQRRVLVFLQWAWNYFTFSRTARLITSVSRRRRAGGEAGAEDRTEKRAS